MRNLEPLHSLGKRVSGLDTSLSVVIASVRFASHAKDRYPPEWTPSHSGHESTCPPLSAVASPGRCRRADAERIAAGWPAGGEVTVMCEGGWVKPIGHVLGTSPYRSYHKPPLTCMFICRADRI